MSRAIVELELPKELKGFRFPKALDRGLQELLDRQSETGKLSRTDRQEAESLVQLAEMLTLLRLRSERAEKGSGVSK